MGDLEELRARAAEREAARKVGADAREAEMLRAVEKYEAELGPEGVAFNMIDLGDEGLVVVKLGPSVVYKKWQNAVAAAATVPGPEDAYAFVAPCLAAPSQEKFAEIYGRKSGVVYRCVRALQPLFDAHNENTRSKF